MLKSLYPFAIRGVIWYQGERNYCDGMLYIEKFSRLVSNWRKAWNEPKMPFYTVQIAPYVYRNAKTDFILPEFWEAQMEITKKINNIGIVATNDIGGNVLDAHPNRKIKIGQRLALQALKKTYDQNNIMADTPTFKSFSIEGSNIRVLFNNVPTGLKSNDNKKLTWFEILDAKTGNFVKAQAKIEGKSIILNTPGVKNPLSVRFGWNMKAQTNLVTDEGLPVYPFKAELK